MLTPLTQQSGAFRRDQRRDADIYGLALQRIGYSIAAPISRASQATGGKPVSTGDGVGAVPASWFGGGVEKSFGRRQSPLLRVNDEPGHGFGRGGGGDAIPISALVFEKNEVSSVASQQLFGVGVAARCN